MAVQRIYEPIRSSVKDSAKLLPDLPSTELSLSDYVQKVNWERFNLSERKRVGWDFPAPLPGWTADMLGSFDPASPCEAIKGIRRPNGTYAIVGCGGGKIKAFSYDLNAWETIGSGYSADGDPGFLWWQIEDVAGYAVFNNGRDCPCTWQVGDTSVTPIYEFREQGYASCGHIVEYYGVLICCNILEIDPTEMSALMNGPTPYETIPEGGPIVTTRIGFERIWSNIGAPRDFAAVVDGTIEGYPEASFDLVLAWPMASFEVGDQIIILGAGAAGGNLTTTITAINGVYITIANAAQTTVTNAQVSKSTALDSIVGSDQLEGDGSTLIVQATLKNQLISYKQSGEIYQSYYTGDTTQPFASQRMSEAESSYRPIRFPRTLVNVLDQYHLFVGMNQVLTYQLSAQTPTQHELFLGAQKSLLFDKIQGVGTYSVWAQVNGVTGEVFIAYPLGVDEETEGYEEYSARAAIAVNFNEGQESIDPIDGFNFICAATVSKPIAGSKPDPTEIWFLMGDTDGRVTLYGKSNEQIFTYRRYGETFAATITGPLTGFAVDTEDRISLFSGKLRGYGGDAFDKYIRRLTLLMAGPQSTEPCTISLYTSRASNETPVLRGSKLLTNPIFPLVYNCYFRKAYAQFSVSTSADSEVRYTGHLWLLAGSDIDQVSQISP